MTDRLQSRFLRDLTARGAIHQATDIGALDAACAAGPVSGYIGFDMTAPSLHVGNLAQVMLLRRLQQAGGRPVVLLGGATTRVGDPSGKDSSRRMLTEDDIAANMASIRGTFEHFLTFGDGPTDAILVDNADWLTGLGWIDFLREYGPHFTVNRMLTFDSVRLRLEREQPLTFLEFNYMLMQAIDFRLLARDRGIRLQMGGSDQWGNIVNGVELARRMDGVEVWGLTTPLITTASGAKMGKTAQGAVWLNADLLSPYEYWQFWRNAEDADVGRFLRLFTDITLDEVARLEALAGAEINDAKVILANAATTMLHGDAAARTAEATARETFAGGRAQALPTLEVARAALEGLSVGTAFTRAGLTASNGEAKRHAAAGALRVNDAPVVDATRMLSAGDLDADGTVKLSLGRKKHALIRVT
jgi:tyrosyl-tRNA synthetase